MFYVALSVLTGMALLTTLRFCIQGTLRTDNRALRVVTHPLWLFSIGLSVPYVLGSFYAGVLSPWPPLAFQQFAETDRWAGLTAAIAVATADLWLLWAAARAAALFAPPEDRRMLPYYYAINLVVGGFFIGRALYLVQQGSLLAPGSAGG